MTQPLRVAQDPRVHASRAALEAQLALSLAIGKAQAEQYYALDFPARVVHADVSRLHLAELDPAVRTSITAFDSAAVRAMEAVGDGFASLLMTVESADRGPTQQARASFAELSATFRRERAAWQTAVRTGLPTLNKALEAQGLPATLMVPGAGRP